MKNDSFTLKINLKDLEAQRFKEIKEFLGISHNTEVVRYLLNKAFKELKEAKPNECSNPYSS